MPDRCEDCGRPLGGLWLYHEWDVCPYCGDAACSSCLDANHGRGRYLACRSPDGTVTDHRFDDEPVDFVIWPA